MKNLFTRIIAVLAGAVLFVGAFVVSVVLFAVIAAIGVLIAGYFLWKTRDVRRQMRQQMHQRGDDRNVIEGTVISSQEVPAPDNIPRRAPRP